MASLIATLWRFVFEPAPEIICSKAVWNAGVQELRKRAGGQRESGAFLLGSKSKLGPRKIQEFVFYDDVDPGSLKTGIVVIDGRRLGALWTHCRETNRAVVADVHVHPAGFQQSSSDQANPIIAEVGHIAIILPDFATREARPGFVGVFQYLGSREWLDRSHERPSPLHIGWWPK